VIINARYIFNQKQQSLPISLLKKVRGLCFVFILQAVISTINVNSAIAQDTNAVVPIVVPEKPVVKHSPRKATILSVVLPGAGQVYNQKYWKLPIVYAGFGACIYFIQFNSKLYHDFNDAYIFKTTEFPPGLTNPFPQPPNNYAVIYTTDQTKTGRDFYRHNLEVSYIFTGVWYILTIVDATVDAHFFDYDISNDLTLNVKPWIPAFGMNTAHGAAGGINLTLRF